MRKYKKWILMLCIALSSILLSGCYVNEERVKELVMEQDWEGLKTLLMGDEWANRCDDMLEEIIEIIEKEDAEALKSMFSEDTLLEAEDFDGQIEELFDFYEGTMVSYERQGGIHHKSGSGYEGYYKRIGGYYKIETTENQYRMWIRLNLSAPEESAEGMFYIWIITEDYWQEREGFGTDGPYGIYIFEE